MYRERIRQLESARLSWPIKLFSRDLRIISCSAWIWFLVKFSVHHFVKRSVDKLDLKSTHQQPKTANFELQDARRQLCSSFLDIIVPLAFYEAVKTKEKNITPAGQEISNSNCIPNQSTNQSSCYGYKCCLLYFQFFPAIFLRIHWIINQSSTGGVANNIVQKEERTKMASPSHRLLIQISKNHSTEFNGVPFQRVQGTRHNTTKHKRISNLE